MSTSAGNPVPSLSDSTASLVTAPSTNATDAR